jgi:hypothetical protein
VLSRAVKILAGERTVDVKAERTIKLGGLAASILGQKFAELFQVCCHCEKPMGDEAISCRFSSAARDCFASLAMTCADLSSELRNQDTSYHATHPGLNILEL